MKRTLFCEAIERRILFAAAPPSAMGSSIDVVVTGGKKPLESSGEYIIHIASTGQSYSTQPLTSNITAMSGTYSYRTPTSDTGELHVQDSLAGTMTATFKFLTSTTGTASIVRAAGGSETGTFKLSGPDFASVSGGVLTLNGTEAVDSIRGLVAKHQYVLTRNNITQKIDTTGITRIDLFAGAGNDMIDFSTLALKMYVDGGTGNDQVTTGIGNDTITGGAGKNTLAGNAGDDRINGSGSPDSILGGAGSDRIYGKGGNDTLDGGGGVDRLFGGDGDDLLIGGASNDKLYGEAGNDTLIGGAGTDLLDGGAGTNKLYQDSVT